MRGLAKAVYALRCTEGSNPSLSVYFCFVFVTIFIANTFRFNIRSSRADCAKLRYFSFASFSGADTLAALWETGPLAFFIARLESVSSSRKYRSTISSVECPSYFARV